MATKAFHIGDILSITDGRLVSNRHIDGVYDILNFMTGENLFTHQLPRASQQCRPWLLQQHPQLADVVGADADLTPESVPEWLQKQVEKFGETLVVSPIQNRDDLPPDPVQELVDMVGREKVIVVTSKD